MIYTLSFLFQSKKCPGHNARGQAKAVLNYSEHILFHWFLAVCLLDFLLRLVQFLQTDHFILRIVQTEVGVGIYCHADVRMPHKVLKSLWVHSGSCHITAVGMPADMRRDVRKLYAEDVNDPVLHVKVTQRESAELADSHSRMEKDVEDLVVFTVYIILNYSS